MTPIAIEDSINRAKLKLNNTNIVKFMHKSIPTKLNLDAQKSRFGSGRNSQPVNLLKNKNPSVYPNRPIMKLESNKLKGVPNTLPPKKQVKSVKFTSTIKMKRSSGMCFNHFIL